MATYLGRFVFLCLVAVASQSLVGIAAEQLGVPDGPDVPTDIQVPEGQVLFLQGHAIGTQNFICLGDGKKKDIAWRFTGPQATLFLAASNDITQQVTTHFLSANPDENGLPRPTWQHSVDTSAVWGRVRASSADPAYVESGAIPWLLLDVAGAQPGPMGGDFLARTTFIQRLNTTGGLAPATGCSEPEHVGAVRLVPYSADYFFYSAQP